MALNRYAALVVGLSLNVLSIAGAAQNGIGDSVDFAELETAFWVCDYTATTRGMEATPVDRCAVVYEELKNVKFGGDFHLLHTWWLENKSAEHARHHQGDPL
jgi:hypothetical protein